MTSPTAPSWPASSPPSSSAGSSSRGRSRPAGGHLRRAPPRRIRSMVGGSLRGGRVLVALLIAAFLLGSCANEPDAGGPGTSGGSATTAGTAPDPAALIARLMRLEDVRPMAALGLDVREQPVLDPQQFALAT